MGVIPTWIPSSKNPSTFPHAHGGYPVFHEVTIEYRDFSPRTWGLSSIFDSATNRSSIFPIYTGVILPKLAMHLEKVTFHHYMRVILKLPAEVTDEVSFSHTHMGLSLSSKCRRSHICLFTTYTVVIPWPEMQFAVSRTFPHIHVGYPRSRHRRCKKEKFSQSYGGYNYYNLVTDVNRPLTFYAYHVIMWSYVKRVNAHYMQHTFQILLNKSHDRYRVLQSSLTVFIDKCCWYFMWHTFHMFLKIAVCINTSFPNAYGVILLKTVSSHIV